MKTTLFLFLSITFFSSITAQNITKLDQNNGFKQFKFGMAPSQIKSISPKHSTSIQLKNVTNYKYTGKEIVSVYGVNISAITLFFYKNRLYQISIAFGDIYSEYTTTQHSLVNYGLKSNFGTQYYECNNEPGSGILDCSIWNGANIELESIRINTSGPNEKVNDKYKYIQGYLLFTDKKVRQQQQNNETD